MSQKKFSTNPLYTPVFGRARKGGTRYPWDKWFQSRYFLLKKDRDYHIRTDSMAQLTRRKGRQLGYHVSISIDDDNQYLEVTARKATENDPLSNKPGRSRKH